MFKLARYLKIYKKEVIWGPVFKLTEAVFELIVPLIVAKIIDVGIKTDDIGYVCTMGLVLLLLAGLGLACALTCQYFASKASQGVGTTLRNEIFKHISFFSYSHLDSFPTHTLVTRVTNDVNQVQLAVAMLIRLASRAPFLAVGSVIMAMSLNFKLAVILIVSTLLIGFSLYFISQKTIPIFRAIQKKLDTISLVTRENLMGIRVIRTFSNQALECERFEKESGNLAKEQISAGILNALLNPVTTLIANVSIMAILWFGGIQVDTGSMTTGGIIAFISYMTQTLLSVIVLATLVTIFTKASASAARINELFDCSTEQLRGDTAVLPLKDAPKISFRNVSFSYLNSEEAALSNIAFDIMKGERIGIVGSTGSGKSTLINLMPGFYDALGDILLDGIRLQDYPLAQLRRKFGISPQRSDLFTGTIKENVCCFEDINDSQIKWALDAAQASEFVNSFPLGFEHLIEQGGKNLSGGQRQRLTIARALIRRPEILILDDSSSALDYSTELKLRNALGKIPNMTIITVSQRISSIKDMDRIIVMDNGVIVGLGSHNELLRRCSIYKEICISQEAVS